MGILTHIGWHSHSIWHASEAEHNVFQDILLPAQRLVQLRSPATAAHDTARTRELTVCVPWCDCLFTQARPLTVAERDDEELRRRPYSECTDEARGATPFIILSCMLNHCIQQLNDCALPGALNLRTSPSVPCQDIY